MKRRAYSVLEVLIATVILGLVLGVAVSGFNMLNHRTRRAFDSLGRTQSALLLLETMRMELSSMVMNPVPAAKDHEGNSFIISKPNRTSIQFVTEKREPAGPARYLVYYEARSTPGPSPTSALTLRKMVWKFTRAGSWLNPIVFPPGWPADWLGPQVEVRDYSDLGLEDMRWQYLVPKDGEGRVFLRIKLVLKADAGGRLLPFTSLVSIPTPQTPAEASECPCVNAPCFDPAAPSCDCCEVGGP